MTADVAVGIVARGADCHRSPISRDRHRRAGLVPDSFPVDVAAALDPVKPHSSSRLRHGERRQQQQQRK